MSTEFHFILFYFIFKKTIVVFFALTGSEPLASRWQGC